MDECEFVNNQTFEALVPILQQPNTTVEGISTPATSEKSTVMSTIMSVETIELKRIFLSDRCDECTRNKISLCPHWRDREAPWKTDGSKALVKAMLAGSRGGSAQRELGGQQIYEGVDAILSPLHVRNLQQANWYKVGKEFTGEIIMGVDPSPGGNKSHYAVTLAIRDQSVTVVSVCVCVCVYLINRCAMQYVHDTRSKHETRNWQAHQTMVCLV
jgi:hypothetical protein